ncbi:FAD-binding protein, partial [bacterium]|nr:FAD-binding protein [bacterium]
WAQGTADEQWARFYIEHSLHDLYFWVEGLGLTWVDMKVQQGNRVHRWHRCANNGLGLMTALMETARSRGLTEVLTSTEAKEIVIQDGRACGIKAINIESGDPVEIQGKTIIAATGGFCANLDMVFEARPDLKGQKIMEGGGRPATGSGHKLIRKAGGYMTHMENVWFYVYATPDYRDPRDRRGLVFRWTPGYIWVNQQGRRFHNEIRSGGAAATPAMMAQDPCHAWAILDTPMTADMEVADPYYRKGSNILRDKVQELLDNSPYIRKADTLPELGRKIGVDIPTFLTTVENYNRACEDGLESDPEFGKPLKDSKKFDTPPYYAIQIFPLARKSLGGVKTDIKCRVLNKHFEPIRSLYAAGEVAGMAGGHINGRAALEGTMLGPSIISGRVAGAWAAAEAGYGRGFVGKPNRP